MEAPNHESTDSKELRENLKLLYSDVVFTLLVVGHYRYYAGMMEDVALGFRSAGTFLLQPLTLPVFLVQAGLLCCALFGAVLAGCRSTTRNTAISGISGSSAGDPH